MEDGTLYKMSTKGKGDEKGCRHSPRERAPARANMALNQSTFGGALAPDSRRTKKVMTEG